MPTRCVEATLPFPTAHSTKSPRKETFSDGPAVLSIWDARPIESAPFFATQPSSEDLLDEACDLARKLGCELRRRLLGGAGGGCRWVRGRMQIVLDVEADIATRLAIVADALRGDARLALSEMSNELAEYLQPRRAA